MWARCSETGSDKLTVRSLHQKVLTFWKKPHRWLTKRGQKRKDGEGETWDWWPGSLKTPTKFHSLDFTCGKVLWSLLNDGATGQCWDIYGSFYKFLACYIFNHTFYTPSYLIGWDDLDVQTENFLKVYVMKRYFRASKWRRRQKIQKVDIGNATVSLFARVGYSDVLPQPRHMCIGLI